MVKFTIEEIRALMEFSENIRNMSGTPSLHHLCFYVRSLSARVDV